MQHSNMSKLEWFRNCGARPSILFLAGVYVLYLAFRLVRMAVLGNNTLALPVLLLAVAAMALCGALILRYAIRIMKQSYAEEMRRQEEEQEKQEE